MVAALVFGLLAAFLPVEGGAKCSQPATPSCHHGPALRSRWAFSCRSRRIVLPGWLLAAAFAMMIPSSIAGVIVYKMGEVRRAARWPSAQGRIVRSGLRAVDTRTPRARAPGATCRMSGTSFRSMASTIVATASASGRSRRTAPTWRRRSSATRSDAPGRSTTTPTIPRRRCWSAIRPSARGRCTPSLPGSCSWVSPWSSPSRASGEIVQWLQPHFPPGAFIPGFLFFLACGLFAGVMVIARPCHRAAGGALADDARNRDHEPVESRRELMGGGANRTIVVWSPLVEYVYRVGTRDYHGTPDRFWTHRVRRARFRRGDHRALSRESGGDRSLPSRQSLPGNAGNPRCPWMDRARVRPGPFSRRRCSFRVGSSTAQARTGRTSREDHDAGTPPPSRAAWCAGS